MSRRLECSMCGRSRVQSVRVLLRASSQGACQCRLCLGCLEALVICAKVPKNFPRVVRKRPG